MARQGIWLDMDGVLADFVKGSARLYDRDPTTVDNWHFFEEWGFTAKEFFAPMGYSFWKNLELTPEAHEVVRMCEDAVGPENIGLLTAPCGTEGCVDGKLAWVHQHFPQYTKQCFVGHAKYLCAHSDFLLVDDNDDQCTTFSKAGGAACLFPRPWNKARAHVDKPLEKLKHALMLFRSLSLV